MSPFLTHILTPSSTKITTDIHIFYTARIIVCDVIICSIRKLLFWANGHFQKRVYWLWNTCNLKWKKNIINIYQDHKMNSSKVYWTKQSSESKICCYLERNLYLQWHTHATKMVKKSEEKNKKCTYWRLWNRYYTLSFAKRPWSNKELNQRDTILGFW